MSAGMMPAFDFPGLMRPGQFGPMIRVLPCFSAYAKNAAVSCTGTPSVITTTSGMPASTASTTAALVKAGGTKTTETSAPVSDMASATDPNTGTSRPSTSTLWPAFLGFTPPTMFVPEASMRRVCFMPSEPVIPWTTTLLFSVRKMDISKPLSLRDLCGNLSGAVGATVHRLGQLDQRVVGLVEDPPAFRHVVPVETYDERLVCLVTQHVECLHDPVGDRVACRDATEHVDEHA